MSRPPRKLHKEYPFLKSCFGRGLRHCRCPDILKPICKSTCLSELRSPIPLRAGRGERPFGYTSIDNRIFRPWAITGGELHDSIKMTYAFLVSKADNVTRWIYAKPAKRAEERGIPERTLVEHEKVLQEFELILRVPYCKINRKSARRFLTVFLLDLPPNFGNVADEIEEAAGEAWNRNEVERSGKRVVPPELAEFQSESGDNDDAWGRGAGEHDE